MTVRSNFIWGTAFVLLFSASLLEAKRKKPHPFDHYDHEMHLGLFEVASVACETCHADPDSFTDRKKVNRLGCHLCHNSPDPILPAENRCTVCHDNGPPKPPSHKVDWKARHQIYAKQNPEECRQCHTDAIFCLNCHKKRQTVEETMHRRNFKFFHSIEARANPRKCDACHTVNYCQECHSGRGSSKR